MCLAPSVRTLTARQLPRHTVSPASFKRTAWRGGKYRVLVGYTLNETWPRHATQDVSPLETETRWQRRDVSFSEGFCLGPFTRVNTPRLVAWRVTSSAPPPHDPGSHQNAINDNPGKVIKNGEKRKQKENYPGKREIRL